MATRVFYTDTLLSLVLSDQPTWTVRGCSLSRGSGVVTKTQDSAAISPLAVRDTNGGATLAFAIQVNAFSATTGNYTWNHWGSETNAMANFTAGHPGGIEVYDSTGTNRFNLVNPGGVWNSASEYGTSAAARTPSAVKAGTARSINDGDWIVFRPNHVTVGSPAAGFSLTFSYNGTSAAADGDTYMDCPDTFTEYTPPVANLLSPRDITALLAQ